MTTQRRPLGERIRSIYVAPSGPVLTLLRAGVLVAALLPRELFRHVRRRPVLIVHQPGKVGSRAAVSALRTAESRSDVYHSHLLQPTSRQRLWRQRGDDHWAPRRTWAESAILSRLLRRGRRETRVLSIVRRPEDRLASAFFETPERYLAGVGVADATADELRSAVERLVRTDPARTWYEAELRDYWGFALHGAGPALREGGLHVESRDGAFLIIVRYEDLDERFYDVSRLLVGRAVDLPRVNVTANKRYSSELRNRVRRLVDEAVDTPRGADASPCGDGLPSQVYGGAPERERA